MPDDAPFDLPVLSAEELYRRAQEPDPWPGEPYDGASVQEGVKALGPYMGTTTREGRKPVYLDPIPDDDEQPGGHAIGTGWVGGHFEPDGFSRLARLVEFDERPREFDVYAMLQRQHRDSRLRAMEAVAGGAARWAEHLRAAQMRMAFAFGVPGAFFGLERPTKGDLAARRRLATQQRRTERRAARRRRRASRGR